MVAAVEVCEMVPMVHVRRLVNISFQLSGSHHVTKRYNTNDIDTLYFQNRLVLSFVVISLAVCRQAVQTCPALLVALSGGPGTLPTPGGGYVQTHSVTGPRHLRNSPWTHKY